MTFSLFGWISGTRTAGELQEQETFCVLKIQKCVRVWTTPAAAEILFCEESNQRSAVFSLTVAVGWMLLPSG